MTECARLLAPVNRFRSREAAWSDAARAAA